MENKNRIKSFDNIYKESNQELTNKDKVELMTNFISKMKEMIHIGRFLIQELEKEIKEMFVTAGELEIEWGKYITQNKIMGFTDDIIEQYIHYLVDDRLKAVGYEKIYNVANPIKWVDDFSKFNDQKTNFFEGNVSNYSKGSLSFDDF